MKALSLLFVYGQYFEGESETPAGVETTGRMDAPGRVALTPKWEIAGRFAEIDPNTDTDNNDQTEWRGGISWYMKQAQLEDPADYGETKNEAAAATTNRR